MVPLTVNQLILGRSSVPPVPVKYLEDDNIPQRVKYVEKIHQVWWNMWTKKILPTMLPARKWQKKKDDIKIGDICLLLYKGRVKDDYKLCKVLDTHPGQDKLIRTVTVGHRRKNVRDTKKVMEDPSKYRSLPMVEERVHVQ